MNLDIFDLSFSKYSKIMGEKSSIKSRKYVKFLIEGTRLGPQTSE